MRMNKGRHIRSNSIGGNWKSRVRVHLCYFLHCFIFVFLFNHAHAYKRPFFQNCIVELLRERYIYVRDCSSERGLIRGVAGVEVLCPKLTYPTRRIQALISSWREDEEVPHPVSEIHLDGGKVDYDVVVQDLGFLRDSEMIFTAHGLHALSQCASNVWCLLRYNIFIYCI